MSDKPCPACGFCPTCGRSHTRPFVPYPWAQPWTSTPWTTPYRPYPNTTPRFPQSAISGIARTGDGVYA